MSIRSLMNLERFFDVRPGEIRRVGVMAALLFFLLAANNIIKIVRDSLFLSRFPITQLPYVYLMAALLAGVIIGIYSRYTSRLSLSQVILGSHVVIISNVIVFWVFISFSDFAWVLYGFYMWSAIVGLVAVAQFWTLANEMFNPREAKRLFGILTAAGTLGAMAGGFAASLAVSFLFSTNELLWLIVVLFAGAFTVALLTAREGQRARAEAYREGVSPREPQAGDETGIFGTLRGSRHLQAIAALIFVSVIVSTLIDYQFKAAAKEAYLSNDALAAFFGFYYAWLSVLTLPAQAWLAPRLFIGLGITPSLLLLPLMLLAGSVSFLIWPGLVSATATRLAEASLRTSVNRTALEILYLPIPPFIKKQVKVFLDVTVERLGDGTAALLILFCAIALGRDEMSFLSYLAIGLIVAWSAAVFIVQRGYMAALRRSLAQRDMSLADAPIDFGDKQTVEAVLKTIRDSDEPAVLFGLDLVEKMEPKSIVSRLPRELLRHPSPAVRRRAIELFSRCRDSTTLKEITRMLRDSDQEVRAQAISAACHIYNAGAISLVRGYLESPDPRVKGSAVECLLRHGDAVTREAAFNRFCEMLNDSAPNGERGRVEAARIMGEVHDITFVPHLVRLIRDDPSSRVIQQAITSAGRLKYPEVLGPIVSRLADKDAKAGARAALIQYGEAAVKVLRDALFDPRISRDIRLNIPRTLSKIHSQSAMNALLDGLSEEDRPVRFQAIVALEEMARRFADLKFDRDIVESAIVSDVVLYSRRFASFYVLFDHEKDAVAEQPSLLRLALRESMERVRERVVWLLSLIYPAKDIRAIWGALNSADPSKQANAVELLDNLLTGDIKRYSFPLYGDALEPARFSVALGFLGWSNLDADTALRLLLEQEDIWLTAATIWEIGLRRPTGFREEIVKQLGSENALLRETAELVIQRI